MSDYPIIERFGRVAVVLATLWILTIVGWSIWGIVKLIRDI